MTGRPLRISLLALVAVGASGCPSISTMGTARTIPAGSYQYYAGLGYAALQKFARDDQAKAESIGVPGIELGARHGVTDRLEVGGKIFPVGAEVGAKFQVLRSDSLERGLDLAVAPAISAYPWSKGMLAWGHLAIPVGFNVGGGNQLVLAPRVSELFVTSKEGNGTILWGGGSMGLAFRVGKSGALRIMPEISAVIRLSKKLPTDVEDKFALEGPIFQGGIGFLFGP